MEFNKKCGLIMPISGINDYSAGHWIGVKKILASIVSDAINYDNTEVVSFDNTNPEIKSRIFNHLFEIPLVICDVSGNNPNVLYELGLRVAFDMPIIIVIDEKTKFNFDLSSFEHVMYPTQMTQNKDTQEYKKFRKILTSKIKSVYSAYKEKNTSLSPLSKFLSQENYFQIKRGVPFDISGKYEYKCYRENQGYAHGGICSIYLRHVRGNMIEWHLQGKRCWKKDNHESPLVKFQNPYNWNTNKAVIFPDKSYLLSYGISTPESNILGFIRGNIETSSNDNIVLFNGDYYQDEGKRLIKGGFIMNKIDEAITYKNYSFPLCEF
ncbi:hypothetical protein DVR12_02660 [Chitinophaga silvatica]|uniref:Uncharacterized protein n=1 Tax=Chitinophaga silvatica TaxID=2282649 RepID=A0A3E1YH61_9BACT|nr:hypothetical protein [Chitinophaga silvatica]RFS26707.1 hypothetical protein DVR12_02660 [Chitinophaga silvatica]